MNDIEKIRSRINKKGNNKFLCCCNYILGILIIVLSSLIYMKKDPNGDLIQKLFNENISFVEFNRNVSNLFSSMIVYRNDSNETYVSNELKYIDLGNDYYCTSNNNINALAEGTIIYVGKESEKVSLITQYRNGVIASYFFVNDISCNEFDEVDENSVIGTYEEKFRVIFKKGNETLKYNEIF